MVILLTGSLVLGGPTLAVAGEFEGVLQVKDTRDGNTSQQQWFMKGDKLRFEELGPEAGKGAVIFDAQKRVMYSIDHQEKAYMEIMTPHAGDNKMVREIMNDMVVTKTGKRDNVAGYPCEMYVSKDKSDGSTAEFCVARGLGNAAMFGMTSAEAGRSGVLPAWMRDIFKDGGFPIKAVERDQQGKEESRWEALKIEKKRLDDKLFIPPPAYKKQDMASMMEDMQSSITSDPSKDGPSHDKRSDAEGLQDIEALMKKFGEAVKQGQPKKGP
jgi:hypothetical protein